MINWKYTYKRFLIWRLRHVSDRNFILIASVFIGICAGIIALVLKTAVFHVEEFLLSRYNFKNHYFIFLFLPLIGVSIALVFKHYVINDHIKHNISSILHAISQRNSLMKGHKIFSSVFGAIFTAGFGGSIGLESPIISAGAAFGSNAGRVLHLNYKSITLLLACGASGAIAAIFSTPITAIVFAFEVLLIDLTGFSLIPLILASVSGAITTRLLFEEDILFEFVISQPFLNSDIPFIILFGVLAGFVSLYFSSVFIYFETVFDRIKTHFNKLVIGGIVLSFLIFFFPALYGEGYGTIKALIAGEAHTIYENSFIGEWKDTWLAVFLFFLALLLFKVIATITTIGAGGIGGIFAPSLFTGAIFGYLFVFTINSMGFGFDLDEINFILVGMSSVLGGVLGAPLTGIFLIAEITRGYELILPLMLSTVISFVTFKSLKKESIITHQLAKSGELITHHKDKAVLRFMKLKSVIEMDFVIVNIDDKLGDLVNAISKSKRNIFPILDEKDNFMGIVTLDDVRDIMFNHEMYDETYVRNLLSVPDENIRVGDSMEEVMRKFRATGAWNLPVLLGSKYVGFVSKSKLFSVYRKHLMDITED
jgi:chloride channel protein, CIC family